MKSYFLIALTLCAAQLFSQSLLDLKESETKRESENKFFNLDSVPDGENKAMPLISFGTNLNAGTDAIGFKPVLVSGISSTKGILRIEANIKGTQPDDQEFSVQKTGQSLFVNEISNFSANLNSTVAIFGIKGWKDSTKNFKPWMGVNAGVSIRGNSLFNIDSTTFRSEKNDIFSITGFVGVEFVLIQEYISVYCNYNYLGITNNRDAYHNYFPSNAIKDFWYFQPGFKFRALEGKDEYKNLIFDVSVIGLTSNMRVIAGKDNTLIPILKIGYVQQLGFNKGNK